MVKVFGLPAPPLPARPSPSSSSSPVVSAAASAPFPGLLPTMSILACVLPALTFLCQPALDALQACVGNQAQIFFTFLANWAGGLFGRCWESPGVELPELASVIVGAEETLSEIRSHLRDGSTAGIIGIYGMGGVGKSTILRRIHNELLESGSWRGSFDLMIWVTVSQTVNISQIQKQIADRLGLSLSGTEEENAGVLFKALSEKRFLVVLDDLWKALELQLKIGIPSPKKRRNSKIVLTTRLSQVCDDMDADEIVQVKPLDKDPSWELFCSKLRLDTKDLVRNNPTIRPQLAQQVVRRCGGLPLALITVGKAMASKKLRQEWEHAVEALDHCAEQLHGMEEEVLGCLKFSYDNLKNDNMRSALLLCAMYPEDEDIWKERIIWYWFGEGLLDDGGAAGGSNIDGARNRGHVLISQLQDACLLEPGMLDNYVRMHDAVRDMGWWLNSHDHDNNLDGFLVCDGGRAVTGADQLGRERVKRIWMRDQLLEEETSIDLLKYYPSNRTLVLTDVQGLTPSVLQGIAGFMKTTLRVLDLSESDVEELPDEVGLMVELRYLDLSHTRIKALPRELGNLVKLRILGLRGLELQSIPREAMAGLSSLQSLDMIGTSYDWEAADSEGGGGGGRQLSLSDLESGLRSLQELHIQLGTRRSLVRVLESDRLCRCTRSLQLMKKQSEDPLYGEGGSSLLQRVFDKTGSSLRTLLLHGDDDSHPWVEGLRINLDQLPRLETLCLLSFKKLSELVFVGSTDTNHGSRMVGGWTPSSSVPNTCLVSLFMGVFDGLKVLKLVGEFPCLQEIDLEECKAMEVLVLDDGVEAGTGEEGTQDGGDGRLDSHFPMLRKITLTDLPRLKSIGPRPLCLPELRSFRVENCPELRRIPLDAAGVPKLERITGERNWWASVEFTGHNTKPVFEKLYYELSSDAWTVLVCDELVVSGDAPLHHH